MVEYKNIVLVTPAPVSHRTAEENIGLGYLASVLRLNKFNVVIIDGWLENLSTEEIIARIYAIKNIMFIGFSCYRSNMNLALEVCNKLRNKNVCVPFVAGGFGPSFYVEDFLNSGFDIVVRGEAEVTIIELAECFFYGSKNLRDISGICFKEKHEIVYTSSRPLIEDINSIPFPSRDTVNHAIKKKSLVNILSSRGCQAHCIFCSIVAFQRLSNGKNWRERTIINFVDEIEALWESGVRYFKVIDDSFIEPPRDATWCIELAKEINARGIDAKFRGSIRADRVTDEIIFHLKNAGFFSFSCGIENGSSTALRRMGKPASLQMNENALKIFHKYGIYVQAGFILFDPYTTITELEENYEFMKKYDFAICKGIFTEMYAAAGTPFTSSLQKKGLVSHEFSNHGNSNYTIKDDKVRLLYDCFKCWHKAHSKLYDQTIDPISAPKALNSAELAIFHKLFMQLRRRDLKFMHTMINIVKRNQNVKRDDALKIVHDEISGNSPWYEKFSKKVDKAYAETEIEYRAEINPFIC